MIWKNGVEIAEMTVLRCAFCMCVATGTKIQTTSLLLSTCLRTAICLPEASNWEHSKFFTFWKISLSRCLRCIVCFFDGFWKVQFLRCPCVIHFRFWLHRTRCFCPAITWQEREKWQLRSLEKKRVGSWWGWMDEYTSWVQHREDTGHHDNHDYHEHVWSIRMLQNFYPRCFGVWNIWEVFEEKDKQQRALALECVVVCNQKHLWASKQLYLHIQLAMGK